MCCGLGWSGSEYQAAPGTALLQLPVAPTRRVALGVAGTHQVLVVVASRTVTAAVLVYDGSNTAGDRLERLWARLLAACPDRETNDHREDAESFRRRRHLAQHGQADRRGGHGE